MKKLLTILSLISVLTLAVIATPAKAAPFTAEQEAAIKDMIREVVTKDPDILADALSNLGRHYNLKLLPYRDLLWNDKSSPMAGNPDGDVTIVEFHDYNCGYCKKSAAVIKKILAEDPKVKVIFKEYPIFGEASQLAAKAALAADRQGKYGEMHFALMEHKGSFSMSIITGIAKELGLDVEKLKADIADGNLENALQINAKLAEQLGITGTPSFVVGNSFAPGFLDESAMKELIKANRLEKDAQKALKEH